MRKKISITAAILVVLLAIGLTVFWPRDEGPLYEGKTVGYWMAHPTISKDTGNVSYTVNYPLHVFPKFDSDAVPHIVKVLEQKDTRAKLFYLRTWQKSPEWLQRKMPEPIPAATLKRNALIALSRMGPAAKPALPAILQCVKDPDIDLAISAVVALNGIGFQDKEVQEALTVMATSTNAMLSQIAISVLHPKDK